MATTNSLNNFTSSLTINDYTMPAADGTANQIMQTDGNGSVGFVNPSVGTLVKNVSVTNVTDVVFDNLVPGGYLLIFSEAQVLTTGSYLRLQFSYDNGATWSTAGYLSSSNIYLSYTTSTITNNNSTGGGILSGASGSSRGISGFYSIMMKSLAVITGNVCSSTSGSPGSLRYGQIGCATQNASVPNAFKIFADDLSGNAANISLQASLFLIA
jgi:hypothetical protein